MGRIKDQPGQCIVRFPEQHPQVESCSGQQANCSARWKMRSSRLVNSSESQSNSWTDQPSAPRIVRLRADRSARFQSCSCNGGKTIWGKLGMACITSWMASSSTVGRFQYVLHWERKWSVQTSGSAETKDLKSEEASLRERSLSNCRESACLSMILTSAESP